ncbi:serine/threonine-protein kinase pim-2-like [Erpetoichthys calabaricus]|uniref:serine/threonine-protein kinase pim-2-like n=1 Tax=Erpetoichthys calabaricus TaxID=27687 RepID=UPI002234E959|nr:serine/threonine-protein kinase pim-2-like [Erpetoichthys calabaricus]
MKMVSQEPACPSIIKLLDWCEAEDKFVLIMERPKPCKNLYEFVMVNGGFGEVEARRLFRQLVEAHQHCEARGVFHRDLKPDNVIIQTSTHNVKLTDFGCGSLLKDAPFSSFIGKRG